ncbi:hypothetical protein MNV49_004723 [Pseudohyphozyma bogoriensis]|nr:hypothetical protein MNV49_004723 [Pseudohyphozyma bogoriensis]
MNPPPPASSEAPTQQPQHPPAPAPSAGNTDGEPKAKKQRRAYKACVGCKSKKLKCDLGDTENPSDPPCARCRRANKECVFVESKYERGARGIGADASDARRMGAPVPASRVGGGGGGGAGASVYAVPSYGNHLASTSASPPLHLASSISPHAHQHHPAAPSHHAHAFSRSPSPHSTTPNSPSSAPTNTLLTSTLHNPGDALRLLLGAAVVSDSSEEGKAEGEGELTAEECWERWEPVREGVISAKEAATLLIYFETEMAPLYPLLCPQTFLPSHLPTLTTVDSLLLGAILTIAARHSPLLLTSLRLGLSNWICGLLIKLLNGSPKLRGVGGVEALLLLAEWPSLMEEEDYELGKGEEGEGEDEVKAFLKPSNQYDSMSWSYIGFAVRLAQELGLHNDSIYPRESDGKARHWNQERNMRTWLFCYNADRHVSIRLGRNTVVQAYMTSEWWEHTIELSGKEARRESGNFWTEEAMNQGYLAALMGTIQERLYPDKEITRHLLKSGQWEGFLRSLEQELKVIKRKAQKMLQQDTIQSTLLHIEISYVHLYGCAIALRALQERLKKKMKDPLSFYNAPSLLNLAEGPWTIDALAAAQSTLQLTVEILEPKGFLRLCPSRIFQRILFAATFLYKALAVGVVEHGQSTLLTLLNQTIAALQRSSIDSVHIARVFSILLERIQDQCHPTMMSEPHPHVTSTTSTTAQDLAAMGVSAEPSSQTVPSQTTAAAAAFDHLGWGSEVSVGGGGVSEGVYADLDNFGMPWQWDPSAQAFEAGRDQDVLFQTLWNNDMTGQSSNYNLLGTLFGDELS